MRNIFFSYLCTYLMHPLRGQVGGGWALEIKTFLGPVIRHQAVRRVPFGAQPPPTCPSNGCCPHQKNHAQGRINHRRIGSLIYKSSRLTLKGYLREVSGPIPPLHWGLITFTQITALLPPPPSPPHPELIRNQQETVMCVKDRSGT